MIRQPAPLILAVFLLGAYGDFYVWGKTPGINFAIFITLCLLLGWLALYANDLVPARQSTWLFLPSFFFAWMTGLTALDPTSLKHWVAFVFTLFFAFLLSITYLGGRWEHYSASEFFDKFFQLVVSIIVGPFRYYREQVRDARRHFRGEPDRLTQFFGAFLTIGIPVILVFLALLALADLIFRRLFTGDTSPVVILAVQHLPGIFLWAYILVGIFLHAGTQSRDEHLNCDERPPYTEGLSFARSAAAHLGMIAPLSLFAVLQFFNFLWGKEFITAFGVSYHNYVTYGYWGLTLIAGLSLVLVHWLNTCTRCELVRDRQDFWIMNLVIFILVIVVLMAANQHLSLATFGMHETRHLHYAQGVLVWLGSLFACFVYLEHVHQEQAFSYYALIDTSVFAALLCLTEVGALL